MICIITAHYARPSQWGENDSWSTVPNIIEIRYVPKYNNTYPLINLKMFWIWQWQILATLTFIFILNFEEVFFVESSWHTPADVRLAAIFGKLKDLTKDIEIESSFFFISKWFLEWATYSGYIPDDVWFTMNDWHPFLFNIFIFKAYSSKSIIEFHS